MKLLLYSFLISLGLSTAVYFIVTAQQKKVAVVDAVRLFNEYDMKKEMEAGVGGRLEFFGNKLDSMGQQIKALRQAGDEEAAGKVEENYQNLNNALVTEYEAGNQNINEQVWKRLNPLIDQFGKEHNLHLIIGANGMGSVLYNDDYYDMTNEMIEYVNKKYRNE